MQRSEEEMQREDEAWRRCGVAARGRCERGRQRAMHLDGLGEPVSGLISFFLFQLTKMDTHLPLNMAN